MMGQVPFTPIRIFGGLFAMVMFAGAALRYRRRAISRLSLILTVLVSTAIIVLAISPSGSNENARAGTPRAHPSRNTFGRPSRSEVFTTADDLTLLKG